MSTTQFDPQVLRDQRSVPLTHQMPNGATVSDWLGTAGLAAGMAVTFIRNVRGTDKSGYLGVARHVARQHLNRAEAQLEQALEEVRAIRSELERI